MEHDYTTEEEEAPVEVRMRLNVSDGFRFGCGFIAAVTGLFLILSLIITIAFLIASLLRLPFPFL
ncbi:MAG: hypothetical protein HYX89_01320 [Chloroflexi bacterium]|nr:hypothetical protein [Chloroflexota bacterium]